MLNNMSNLDRAVRALFAVVVIILYWLGMISGIAAVILGIIAALFILTSILGYCPTYHLLGLSTKKK
jgi:hypothetical protein